MPPLQKTALDRLHAIAAHRWVNGPTMSAIRNGFLLSTPLVVVACIALLLNNLPISAYQEFMGGMFGPDWKNFGTKIWQGTFGIIALPMLYGISHHLVRQHNQKCPDYLVSPIIGALVAFSSLVVILPPFDNGMLTVEWTGPCGLFVAMIVALSSTRLFIFLMGIRRLRLELHSEWTNRAIPQALSSLLPTILTILLFATFDSAFVTLAEVHLHQFVHNMEVYPFTAFKDTLGASAAFIFIGHALWFVGIHGANVLGPLANQYYEAVMQLNLSAQAMGLPIPNTITRPVIDTFVAMGGSGSTICLLLALLFASKNNGNRRLAQLSIIPGIFNINELLLFGLPIILNPVFLIPFILVPLVLLFISHVAISCGFVPMSIIPIDWTTPPIIGGYVATGSIRGSLLQFFNIAIGTLIYLPFVRISDRIRTERLCMTMNSLLEVACGNTVSPAGKKCLDRDDEIGALARMLANDLRSALEKNEGLYLEYQPQIDHVTGKAIGAEALVRWRHLAYGLIPPPIMVAIAEDGDFIKPLGLWVLNEACAERKRWQQGGLPDDFEISVNVSVDQLDDIELPRKIADCMSRHQLLPSMICVEVTESMALDPETQHSEVLQGIHELGIGISIDDFGMGHSSLIYLKHFPVNTLKIDKALSKDIANSRACYEILATIVDLCQSLNVFIVVEFVENQQQIDLLRKLGCHIFQGYFFSKPLAGEAALAYALQKNSGADAQHATA